MNQQTETWNISNRINLYLLNAVESHLADFSASKGRNVGEQFAHVHNVRLMWLKASSPELMQELNKIEKPAVITKEMLITSLNNSSAAIEKLLEKGFEDGKIKNFKPHPAAFLGYLLAHEAHHRGQIILSLKQSGHMPDKKVLFSIWEWGSR